MSKKTDYEKPRRELVQRCQRFSQLASERGYEIQAFPEFEYNEDRTKRYHHEAVLIVGKRNGEEKLLPQTMNGLEIQDELVAIAKEAATQANSFTVRLYSIEEQLRKSTVINPGIWVVDFCNDSTQTVN